MKRVILFSMIIPFRVVFTIVYFVFYYVKITEQKTATILPQICVAD